MLFDSLSQLYMADYKTFTLRLNYDDPEHDKIIAAFDGLDKSRFSTKTKFIICALNHYIDYLNMTDAEELFKDRLSTDRRPLCNA